MNKKLPGELVETLLDVPDRSALLSAMAECVAVWDKALDLQTLCRKVEEQICAPRSWTRIEPPEVRGAAAHKAGHRTPKPRWTPRPQAPAKRGPENGSGRGGKGGRGGRRRKETVMIFGRESDDCEEAAAEIAEEIFDAWETRQGKDARSAWNLIVLRCELAQVLLHHYACVAEQLWLRHGLPDTGEAPDTWGAWENFVRKSVAQIAARETKNEEKMS